jgi:hypothetical protein
MRDKMYFWFAVLVGFSGCTNTETQDSELGLLPHGPMTPTNHWKNAHPQLPAQRVDPS